MEWTVPCTKKNGARRKQFLQWSVPKAICDEFGLKDGMLVHVQVSLGQFHQELSTHLTSGNEICVRAVIANKLEELSRGNKQAKVLFQLSTAEPQSLDAVNERLRKALEESLRSPRSARLKRLQAAPNKPEQVSVTTVAYIRNADVIAEVLLRANGVCEECKLPAPFRRANGTPYLEVHHRVRLADGGDDTIQNAVALCPNCHRKMHFGLKRVKNELNVNVIETQGIFEKIENVEISDILKAILEEHIPLAVSINTEKARSELVISNILVEVIPNGTKTLL